MEGVLEFAPMYKYELGSRRYVGVGDHQGQSQRGGGRMRYLRGSATSSSAAVNEEQLWAYGAGQSPLHVSIDGAHPVVCITFSLLNVPEQLSMTPSSSSCTTSLAGPPCPSTTAARVTTSCVRVRLHRRGVTDGVVRAVVPFAFAARKN